MTSVDPPLALFLGGAAAITVAAAAYRWWMEPARRTRRLLANRLGGALDALVMVSDRGEGIALRVSPPGIAVLRGSGDLGLTFGFGELLGVELTINGEVRARAFRGEPRRPLDVTRVRLDHLALRLVFDDLRHPDFELCLKEVGDGDGDGDAGAPPSRSATEASTLALDSARRMFAHLEAVLRRGEGAAVAARPAVPDLAPPPPEPDDDTADAPPF